MAFSLGQLWRCRPVNHGGRWVSAVAALLVIAAPSSGDSTTLTSDASLFERALRSERIVLAQVASSRTVVQNGDPRTMRTVTELVVGQTLKGSHLDAVTLVQLGGRWGLWESHVAGDAVFAPGETVIALLHCRGTAVCMLDALGEGRIKVVGDRAQVFSLRAGTTTVRPVSVVLAELSLAAGPPAAPTAKSHVERRR